MERFKAIFIKIISSFRKLFNKGKKELEVKSEELPDFSPSLYFGYDHWQIFSSYVRKAEKEIKILLKKNAQSVELS